MKTINESVTLKHKLTKALNILPNPSEVLKSKKAVINLFKKTEKHPDIYPEVQGYKDGICKLIPKVTGKGTELFSEILSEFNLREFMRGVLAARDYGYAVLEITEYKEYKGKTIPAKIELAPTEMFGFDSDRKLRIYSTKAKQGIIVEDEYPNKFICIQNEPTLENPYGTGLLDVAYWLAVGLNGNFEFMLTFAEDDGRDKLLGKHSPDATDDEIDDLMDMLVRLRNDSVAAIPDTMEVEKIENKNRGSSTGLYKDVNEMLLRKITKLYSGTDLTMQVQGKGGYSSSKTGVQIKGDALSTGQLLVKDAILKVFEIVADLNSITIPEDLEFTLVKPRIVTKEEAEIDQIYFKMGMRPNAEFFKSRGYPEEHFTIAEVQESTQFSTSDDFELSSKEYTLLQSFDGYRKSIKKKD